MLTLRLHDAGGNGRAVATAIEQHPLARVLTATIVIGVGGASPWRAGDPAPRVVVVANKGVLDPVQRAHLTVADAILAPDTTMVRVAHAAGPHALLAVIEDSPPPFLRGATAPEAAAAWEEVAHHRELATALGSPDPVGMVRLAAERTIELVIALEN